MLLHTVNKSPFESSALADCLAIASADDNVLLLEDGIYAVFGGQQAPHSARIAQLSTAGTRFYVLSADMQARGVDAVSLTAPFKIADDSAFVALAASASAIQSWY